MNITGAKEHLLIISHMEELFILKGVNGQLNVYNDRVVITRKGLFGFLSQGLAGEKTIPIKSIQSVQFKEGGWAANGFIQFTIMGGLEKRGGVVNAVDDENAIVLKRGEQSKEGRKIKDFIENKILELSKPQATTVINQPASCADEILKLKQLLDAGILTQEEFDAKKKQILGI